MNKDLTNPFQQSTDHELPARTRVRTAVLQYLYARDIRGKESVNIEQYLTSDKFDRDQRKFGRELKQKTVEHLSDIDDLLDEHSENWELHRMAVTDRNLLRMGTAELLYMDTRAAVVINECVEIARHMGTGESHGFVNAILDRIREKQDRTDEADSD